MPQSSRQIALVGIVVLAVATIVAYYPALRGGFMFDDDEYLTTNPFVSAPEGLYYFWFTTAPDDYYPLSNTTLWLEWRLWGMNATGYRITNLALHMCAALLIWAVLRKLAVPGAYLAALLFAVHPVNVESVSWIAQRKGLIAIVFFLLSILCYLREEENPAAGKEEANQTNSTSSITASRSGRWYWLSLLAFVLAMLGKGSAAVLPFILPCIILWRRRLNRWDWLRIAPYWIVAAALTGVNVWCQARLSTEPYRTANFAERLAGAGTVVWFYLAKALLPINLLLVYPLWHIHAAELLWWLPLLAAVLFTAVLLYRRTAPQAIWVRSLLFAWVFFCAALAPVLGFTDVGFMQFSLVADHYQNIAIIGVVALAAAAWSFWHDRTPPAARSMAIATAVAVLGIFVVLTWRQNRLYGDPLNLLYPATLENNPDCLIMQINYGSALLASGRLQEATEHYRQALRIKPESPEANTDLGNVLLNSGHLQEAIEQYRKALQFDPNYSMAHYNLGIALLKSGQPEQAMEHYRLAIKNRPSYADAYNNLGNALLNRDQVYDAVEQFQQALRYKPIFPVARYNLGVALDRIGDSQTAIEQFQQAILQNPDYPEAYNALGNDLLNSGQEQQAIQCYRQALHIRPAYPLACKNLAIALMKTGHRDEAIAAARTGLDFARQQGQSELAQQIQAWLTANGAGP